MRKLGIVNISHIFLIFSILFSVTVALWLYRDSDVEQYREFATVYKRMFLHIEYDEAKKLHEKIFNKIKNSKNLDEAWLPFIKTIPDKQLRIELYAQILTDNPNREDAYEQLSFIIDDVFYNEELIGKKNIYLNKLKEIKGIKNSYLKKYNLLAEDQNKVRHENHTY